MGSIMVDGYLVSIGQWFECPGCDTFKKTVEFIYRAKNGKYKTSDIFCTSCFEKNEKNNSNSLNKEKIV